MADRLTIRQASAREAPGLSALALRSKAHWGYSPDFMQACEDELRVTGADIDSPLSDYGVAEKQGTVAGFFALEFSGGDVAELEALFVEPAMIGTGVGRALLNHALRAAELRGVTRLVIQGDPHAEAFYLAAGARRIGERESASIPGRMLPLFELSLAARHTPRDPRDLGE
jgi:N-acetylglutamate synthase-like GNAT family acetyltransferase